jgi:hypothetical protein
MFQGSLKMTACTVGDIFACKDIAAGAWHAVTHPLDTLGSIVDVEDWKNGNVAAAFGHLAPAVAAAVLTDGASAGESVAADATDSLLAKADTLAGGSGSVASSVVDRAQATFDLADNLPWGTIPPPPVLGPILTAARWLWMSRGLMPSYLASAARSAWSTAANWMGSSVAALYGDWLNMDVQIQVARLEAEQPVITLGRGCPRNC